MSEGPSRLSLADSVKAIEFIRSNIEKVNDEFFKYTTDGETDASLAVKAAELLGRRVTKDNIKNLRNEFFGPLLNPVGSNMPPHLHMANRALSEISELRATVADLRGTVSDMAEKMENLRLAVSHEYAKNARTLGKLRDAVSRHDGSLAAVKVELKRAGCSDQEIANAMYIAGAKITNGTTVELPQ